MARLRNYRRGSYRLGPLNNGDFKVKEERNKLLRRPENAVPQQNQRDSPQWLWRKDGIYTTASCYKIITYRGINDKIANIIWNIRVPKEVQAFRLLVARNFILSWDNLQRGQWVGLGRCILFQQEGESINHFLLECTYASTELTMLKEAHATEDWGNEVIETQKI